MPLRRVIPAGLAALLVLTGCASSGGSAQRLIEGPHEAGFDNIAYASWSDSEPDYRLYPGDQLEVRIPSAPELSQKAVTVQPDGRITMPLVGPLMVADRTVLEASEVVGRAYASTLVRPNAEVTVTQATPLKVFVGGEVDKPGVYDMPGPIDALQAVVMAGGFKSSADASRVVVVRRGVDGRGMMRTANLARGIRAPGLTDTVPLRRFDVIYVPRSGIAKFDLAMQQYLRDALPFQFSYALNGYYR